MSIELLSPAGNLEKLRLAFNYGADAAYLGLSDFSLRSNAKNFTRKDLDEVRVLKETTGKKLYCTLNMIFSEDKLDELKVQMPTIKSWPFDAYIISDIGLVPILQDELGEDVELHLSTQASCTNSSSARMYHKMGFKRVILGRETSLDDIKRIKDTVPDLQLEAFVHGAMCMAYSGRCLLSSHLTGRSGNWGDCSHTCRWNYQVNVDERMLSGGALALEEQERPGIYYPIIEENGYTTILSSKDLCMIDHLTELVDAGLDSFKIEGRMKSSYYVAVVTRAYRKALDAVHTVDASWKEFREDLFNISHREYSTGFLFGHGAIDPEMGDSIDKSTEQGYVRDYLFCGFIGEEVKPGFYKLDLKNQLKTGWTIEYINKDIPKLMDDSFKLFDADFNEVSQADHGKVQYIKTNHRLEQGYIIRRETNQ